MNNSVEFTKEVFRLLHEGLTSLGFEKRKSGIMTIEMSHDVFGWIGLNKATLGQKGLLEVNPVVGIRNQKIERFVADLSETKFDEVIPPTLAGNIGYMMPSDKYRPYLFLEDGPIETVANEVVEDIREYGLAFIRSHIDMAALVQGMRSRRYAIRFMVAYRIPVGLYILSRFDQAREFVKAESAIKMDCGDIAARNYRAFASKLTERIEEDSALGDRTEKTNQEFHRPT